MTHQWHSQIQMAIVSKKKQYSKDISLSKNLDNWIRSAMEGNHWPNSFIQIFWAEVFKTKKNWQLNEFMLIHNETGGLSTLKFLSTTRGLTVIVIVVNYRIHTDWQFPIFIRKILWVTVHKNYLNKVICKQNRALSIFFCFINW